MRRVIACAALLLAIGPGRAVAQYAGANVNPGAVAPGFGVSVNASGGLPVPPTVTVSPSAGANVGATPILGPAVAVPTGAVTTPPYGGAPAPTVSPAAAVPPGFSYGGNQQEQTYYYLYLSVLYGLQGPYASPEQRAQLARGISDYFSNGAAATAVPTTGPMAQYFTNGAQATTEPTSSMPNYTFSPPLATAAPLTVEAGPPPPPPAPVPVEAGAPAAEAPVVEAPAAEAGELAAEPEYAPTAPYPPAATVVPGAPPPPPAYTPTPVPTVTPVTPPAPAPAAQPALHRVPATTIIWPMIGGIAIGALLVLLGMRIHPRAPSH